MEQELYDKLIDLIIQTKHECTMDNEDDNNLIWANNKGVELMCSRLQRNLFWFAAELNKEVSA